LNAEWKVCMPDLPSISVSPRQGQEPLYQVGTPLSFTVADFWRWSCSDLLSNATRGILAEYIVACDLGVATGVRAEWDSFDLKTKTGIKVEVKSAAYIQSWYQASYSSIQFSIAPTQAWDPQTGQYTTEKKRQGDVYVFCLLHHKDQATVDPLNLDQWTFFVLATHELNVEIPTQKMLSLSRLQKLNPIPVPYGNIHIAIDRVVS
jgi:hypothetical protein